MGLAVDSGIKTHPLQTESEVSVAEHSSSAEKCYAKFQDQVQPVCNAKW